MSNKEKTKQLIKILIGTAWIDGIIQSEEREYLTTKVSEYNLQDDPDIKSLFSGIKPVTSNQCYEWLEDYLGKNPTLEDYQELLESISALVYSDGDIDIQEAKLLSRLQDFDPESQGGKSVIEQMIQTIRQFYTKAIDQ